MKKEDLITEVLKNMKEITVYKDGYKNSFEFEKNNVYWYWDGLQIDIKYRIFGALKKDEVFNMSLGDAYFCINGEPCCCKITQINHPKVGYRDNYEMIIIIEINRLHMDSGSVINDFQKFFKKYDGPLFEDVEIREELNRFELLDL